MSEGCLGCDELRSDLAAARSRNADVLSRIAILKNQVQVLEAIACKQKERKERVVSKKVYDAVVIERDALQEDVTLLIATNFALEEKVADEHGRVVALRELNAHLVKKNRQSENEIHNDNAIIHTSALAQNFLKMQYESMQKQLAKAMETIEEFKLENKRLNDMLRDVEH